MKRLALSIPAVLAIALLPGCQMRGGTLAVKSRPDSPVRVTAALAPQVIESNEHPSVKTLTPDGRLQVDFHLQNLTAGRVALKYTATFYDVAGVMVHERGPTIDFLNPYQLRAFQATASTPKAKKVEIEVSPAN